MIHKFYVGIKRTDGTRLALMNWLTEHVGPVSSADLDCTAFKGVNWAMEALIEQDYWVIHDSYDHENSYAMKGFFVTLNDDAAAVMFKLTWSSAKEINLS